MVAPMKLNGGSECSVTSIATGNNSQSVFNANFEASADGSGVAVKPRKPYTISKQREKWTEEEHQKFIKALKLHGRAWRQIEEYIGAKTAVQIRSHAQKFFTKVMKEGSSSKEASIEPVEIPPPRPKRKSLHPYPRNNVESSTTSFYANEVFSILKITGQGSHSPTSVLAPEDSMISTSHATDLGSGNVSPISSVSNLSHDLEISDIKDNLTLQKGKEKEGKLSLTLNLGGPPLDDLTLMKTTMELKDTELFKNDNAFPESQIKVGSLKNIKLFGQSVVLFSPLEYSDGPSNTLLQAASGNPLMCRDSPTDPQAPIPDLALSLNSHMASDDIGIGEKLKEKEGSMGISYTGSTSNAFSELNNATTNQDSVDSKSNRSAQIGSLSRNSCRKGFIPYKRFLSIEKQRLC